MTHVEEALTSRQREIYDYIRSKIKEREYGPTVREIGQHFGIQSPNAVLCHLKALQKRGLIQRELNVSRAVQVIQDHAGSRAPIEVPSEAEDLVLSLAEQSGIEPGDVILKAVTLLKVVEDAQREGKGLAIVDANLNVEQEVRGF